MSVLCDEGLATAWAEMKNQIPSVIGTMTQTELDTGTSTTGKLVTAKMLKDTFVNASGDTMTGDLTMNNKAVKFLSSNNHTSYISGTNGNLYLNGITGVYLQQNAVTKYKIDANATFVHTFTGNVSMSAALNTGSDINCGGSVRLDGGDIELATSDSSSDASGDIIFKYGSGNEKARIWMPDTVSTARGPSYRVYNSAHSSLYNGRLATYGEVSVLSNRMTTDSGWNPVTVSGTGAVSYRMYNGVVYIRGTGCDPGTTWTTVCSAGAIPADRRPPNNVYILGYHGTYGKYSMSVLIGSDGSISVSTETTSTGAGNFYGAYITS